MKKNVNIDYIVICHCHLVARLYLTLWTHGLQSISLLSPWDFPGKNTGVGCSIPPPGHLPDPGIEPVSSALAGGFSATKLPGKPICVCVCVWVCVYVKLYITESLCYTPETNTTW